MSSGEASSPRQFKFMELYLAFMTSISNTHHDLMIDSRRATPTPKALQGISKKYQKVSDDKNLNVLNVVE